MSSFLLTLTSDLRNDRFIHPKLATVTYFSSHGAPTVVFNTKSDKQALEGPDQAFVSYPRKRKHICFRGSLLHGCPSELSGPASSEKARLTFLVNLWDVPPQGIKPLPEAALGQEHGKRVPCSRKLLRDRKFYDSDEKEGAYHIVEAEPPPHVIVVNEIPSQTELGKDLDFCIVAEHEEGFTCPLPVSALRTMARTPGAPSTCTVLYGETTG